MDDTRRLNWLEEKDGYALVNDDFGHWAIASMGMQDIPENPPDDLWTSFCVEKHAWKLTIREAIDYAIDCEINHVDKR